MKSISRKISWSWFHVKFLENWFDKKFCEIDFTKKKITCSTWPGPYRPSLSGWVSEIFDRSGVITFCDSNTGLDDRVYFSADKLYLYEKRFGGKYSLSGLLTIGDPINFDAVRMDENEDRSAYHECLRYASIGK